MIAVRRRYGRQLPCLPASLAPATEVGYMMTAFYAAEAAGGIRHEDRAFKAVWPLPVTDISAKDRSWPEYRFSRS